MTTTLTVLYFDGCPTTPGFLDAVERAAASLGGGWRVDAVDLEALSPEDPRRGYGSPTLLLDGRDLFGDGPAAQASLSCRCYRGGPPDAEVIARAVRAFRSSGHQPMTKEIDMTTQKSQACCGPECCATKPTTDPIPATARAPDPDAVRDKVREGYSRIARSGQWSGVGPASAGTGAGCCSSGGGGGGGGCCGPTALTPEQAAQAVGYAGADLEKLPEGANMGRSCGNPTALASLRAGEVVLDLGSGGGFDCFIAGPRVGAGGRVIGVDMTPDMLSKARRNLGAYRERTGLDNVEFRLGEIESLPVADGSVDVVISNCVLNLSPDKPRVWREIARVLRPGGRVAVSDLALLRALPESVREDIEALIGCIAGAELVENTERSMREAGLADIVLKHKPEYIKAMADWQDPLYAGMVGRLPEGTTAADFITSLDISARRPG